MNIKLIGMAACVVAALLLMISGCGLETEEANQLVEEASTIAMEAGAKAGEVNELMAQATKQISDGNLEAGTASLNEAQVLNDEVVAGIEAAKIKIDEASSKNISDTFRQYLAIESKAYQSGVEVWKANRERIATLLADPTLQSPDTLQKMNELKQFIESKQKEKQEAEEEARRLVDENPDEIIAN